MLPLATTGAGHASWNAALFTAVSAVCVTGLTVVDTATYWSGFGQVMITVLTQVVAFGFITAATLLTLVVSRRLGIATRLLALSEGKGLGFGNVRQVIVRVAL